jgi:hypothetical protein
MENNFSRLQLRRRAVKKLSDIVSQSHKVLIIHYSCESFYDIPEGRSARITSIGIKNFESGICTSFSIHKIIEKMQNIKFTDIENHYNEIEKIMLSEYFEFVRKHENYYWIHWNMRDINFGFDALKHRFEILGGIPIEISMDKTIDLSVLLIDKYGPNYISHPRLSKLIEFNKISMRDFMSGSDEALAFNNKKFVELHKSTLKKVDIMSNLIVRTMNNTLKTQAKFKDVYGLTATGVMEIIKENWIVSLLIWLLGIVIGTIISKML